MVGAQAQLPLGADHALGADAADGRGLEGRQLPAAGVVEASAGPGEGDLLARGDVGGAADHPYVLVTCVDGAEGEAIGVGVGLHGHDAAHGAAVPRPADALHGPDFQPGHGEAVGQLLRGEGPVHKLAQPG